MSASFRVRNRRRGLPVDTRLLRRMGRTLVTELLETDEFDLAVYLVGIPEITELNETHLQHQGPTDVITFDYSDAGRPGFLFGEIFIGLDVAQSHARRFHTRWELELARYLVHGILHLCGFDDQLATDRRKMKRAEDRLLRELGERFNLRKIGGHRTRP